MRRREDPRIAKLRRLIAHPATSAEERAAARSAMDRLIAAAPADVPAPAPQAPDPPEIANEWNPGPWIHERTLDNAWAGD